MSESIVFFCQDRWTRAIFCKYTSVDGIRMLQNSNIDILEVIRAFSRYEIDCCLLVPTQTGLEKGIMDATEAVRQYLSHEGLHDYDKQPQGQFSKKYISTILISGGSVCETKTSLYRPETKAGDPRIWISNLKLYAHPNDLIAIISNGIGLIALNCSKINLHAILSQKTSDFWLNYKPRSKVLPAEVLELANKMSLISKRGYIQTLRAGDTGVGFTLETLLGIAANSSKSPDYKGIEIKAGRAKSVSKGRTTIISLVPDWSLSRLKGTKEILNVRGRFNEKRNRNQLFHEFSALKPNSYGMQLKVDESKGHLHQVTLTEKLQITDVTWELEKLSERLNHKHGKTFWVKAETQGAGTKEMFWYNKLTYTAGINTAKLPLLLDTGVITVDYTIKETPTGGAKDQGYLFKINQADLGLLFVAPQSIFIS